MPPWHPPSPSPPPLPRRPPSPPFQSHGYLIGWTPESAEWLGRVFGSGSDYFASSAEYHPLRQILGSRAGAEPSAAVVAEGTLLALGEAVVWVGLTK